MRPRLFIGSSSENLDLAYAAQEELERDAEVTVWNQGGFELSKSAMENLMDTLDEVDFGLFVLAPDDVTEIRDQRKPVVRDNVIFELGLFIGRLGRERSYMVVPQGVGDLHLPTDLLGITPASYDADRQDGNLRAALGPACSRVRNAMRKHGKLATAQTFASNAPEPNAGTIADVGDIMALLQSWMGSRSMSENAKAINFDAVDKELNLAPGSTKTHIEGIARRWRYRVAHRGEQTILFEQESGTEGY